jgi:hypothetical protein
MVCVTAIDMDRQLQAAVSVQGIVGTLPYQFTFEAPVLSAIRPSNTPTTGMKQAAVAGMNFDVAYTPSVQVGSTVCKTTSWSTSTLMHCHGPAGTGTALSVTVSIGGCVASALRIFSFDGPLLTGAVMKNSPTCAGELNYLFLMLLLADDDDC